MIICKLHILSDYFPKYYVAVLMTRSCKETFTESNTGLSNITKKWSNKSNTDKIQATKEN